MRALALVIAMTAPALAAPRTGEAASEEPAAPPLAMPGLRTDGALSPQAREAIDAAARLLAGEPGATVAFALEPRDQGSVALAEALAGRSTTARVETRRSYEPVRTR